MPNSSERICNSWAFLRFALDLQVVHLKLKNKLRVFVVKRGLPGPFRNDSDALWFVSVNMGCSQCVNLLVPLMNAQPPSLGECVRGFFTFYFVFNNTCREVEISLVSSSGYVIVAQLCQYHPSGHLWTAVFSTHCCIHSVLKLCSLAQTLKIFFYVVSTGHFSQACCFRQPV